MIGCTYYLVKHRNVSVFSKLCLQTSVHAFHLEHNPRHNYVPPDERQSSSILAQARREIEEDKKDLQWRTPSPNEWKSQFKLLEKGDLNSDFIIKMQQPIDFSLKGIMKWWSRRKERIERHMQQFIPERHKILGNDLAAAHFLLYRGGSVKFLHSKEWMKARDKEIDLPNKYDPKYKIEAIRCDNMLLYYEGLENIRCLEHLKFLSFHNVATFDDWCLDRVSGSQHPSLEVLDISGTQCTYCGLHALYRIPTLKLLIVDDQKQSVEYELTCSLLEEAIPKLKIVDAETVHGTKKQNVQHAS